MKMSKLKKILRKIIPPGDFRQFLSILSHLNEYQKKYNLNLSKNGITLTLEDSPLNQLKLSFPLKQKYFYSCVFSRKEMAGYFQDMESVQNSDLFIDCGAFPGDFPQIINQLYPGKKIICLEPDKDNLDYLQKVIQKIHIRNTRVLPYAIWDKNGSAKINMGNAGSSLVLEQGSGQTHEVETRTLDTLLSDLNIDARETNLMIKMDIEGAELEAFHGAKETLAKGAFFAIAAYHKVDGEPTYHKLQAWFKEAGYSTQLVYPQHVTLLAKPKK